MATASTADPAKTLQEETTCSICLDFFQDPVMLIECGHNFCRSCITQFWKGSNCSARCPECRHWFTWTHLKPNRQLGNIVEMAKNLSLQLKDSSETEARCVDHQRALALFCKTDEILICTECFRAKTHRNHEVLHADEAAADYKEELQRYLENLKEERSMIQSAKANGEKPIQELLKQIQAKRQEIVSAFQQLRTFLEEQEQLLLFKLGDLEREIERKRDDYASPFVDEISYITDLMGDMEKKDKQPATEFLQNIRSLLDSCEKRIFIYPAVPDSSDIQKRLHQFCQETASLQSSFKKFREDLLKPKWIKENVLLDPETAHPRYVVSADRKVVKWGSVRQEFPYNPKRFQSVRCVLGCEGFTSGKHYWTVDVGDGDYWAVGVARASVEREEKINLEPDEGIWALGLYNDQYKALTSPPTLLDPEEKPTQIQVSLDYKGGTVAFSDAEDNSCLFTFESIDFEEEEIFPFFRVADLSTVLKLCS